MAYRTPARWLAPLALVGAVVAILLVVNSDSSKSSKSGSGATVTSSSTSSTSTTATPKTHHRFYIVKSGDVLSGIAAKTGVPLSQIMRLNPHVDAQTLTVGAKLKLAP